VVNAITLWNTVYLSRAVRFVADQGVTIPDAILS
jgi:TnpA family transposase